MCSRHEARFERLQVPGSDSSIGLPNEPDFSSSRRHDPKLVPRLVAFRRGRYCGVVLGMKLAPPEPNELAIQITMTQRPKASDPGRSKERSEQDRMLDRAARKESWLTQLLRHRWWDRGRPNRGDSGDSDRGKG